jgi:hypothetical protein
MSSCPSAHASAKALAELGAHKGDIPIMFGLIARVDQRAAAIKVGIRCAE